MRQLRSDAKPIDIELAARMYHQDGLSLRGVAMRFGIDHANLIMRFRRHSIPLKSKKEAWKTAKRPDTKGEKNHMWKCGYSKDSAGYIKHNPTGKRVHREIAESVLGRPLKRNEVVHHIDGDKANNANSNLLICHKWYHHWLHWRLAIRNGSHIGRYKPIAA